MGESFRVPKRTGTHADVLYAVGLADVLADATRAQQIRLRDVGDAFQVEAPAPVDLRGATLAKPGYRFIRTADEKPPPGVEVCEYPQEQERARRYQEQAQAARKSGPPPPEVLEQLQQDRPPPWWPRARDARQLQGHLTANKLAAELSGRDPAAFAVEVAAGVERLQGGEISGVRWPVDQVQVFNPPAAKGYARLKPDSTDRNDGTGDAWCDPLVEWLRIRGYYRVATPFHTGGKGEHIRLLTPIPMDISLYALSRIVDELQTAGVAASRGRPHAEPKMDALAALALARLLVQHCEENPEPEAPKIPGLSLRGKRPSSRISGVHIAHYQSLGQSRAVGALQRVALPGWFAIQGPEDVRDWLEVLGEHRAALLSLDDQRSDEIGILLAYRRFLQSPEEKGAEQVAEAFLEFLGQYGCFLMRARERGRRARQFVTTNVRRVLRDMSAEYTPILDDPGFQAVAAAVRRATVSAQAQKTMGRKGYREIRYDLLHDLRRKRELPDDSLMESVAEFISLYNAENARRRELGRPAPRNVTTEEFRAFAALVETRGAAKVGALLCAYGTCREPHEETPAGEEAAPEEPVAAEE